MRWKLLKQWKKYPTRSELLDIFWIDTTEKILKWNEYIFGKLIIKRPLYFLIFFELLQLNENMTMVLLHQGKI